MADAVIDQGAVHQLFRRLALDRTSARSEIGLVRAWDLGFPSGVVFMRIFGADLFRPFARGCRYVIVPIENRDLMRLLE
jgi:hypothetical protein